MLKDTTVMDVCVDASCVLLCISSNNDTHDNPATIDIHSFDGLMRLDRIFTRLCETFGVHRIAIFGDTFCATCNLLENAEDHARRSIHFAASATKAAKRIGMAGCTIRSSVHSGQLSGVTVSSTFVHYAIFGEAFLGAALILSDNSVIIAVSHVTGSAAGHSSLILTPTYRSVELQSGNETKTLKIMSLVNCEDAPATYEPHEQREAGDLLRNPLASMFLPESESEDIKSQALQIPETLQLWAPSSPISIHWSLLGKATQSIVLAMLVNFLCSITKK